MLSQITNTTEGRNTDFVPPIVTVWERPGDGIDCLTLSELPDTFCLPFAMVTARNAQPGNMDAAFLPAAAPHGEQISAFRDTDGPMVHFETCEDWTDRYIDLIENRDIAGFVVVFPAGAFMARLPTHIFDADGALIETIPTEEVRLAVPYVNIGDDRTDWCDRT